MHERHATAITDVALWELDACSRKELGNQIVLYPGPDPLS